MAIQLFILNVLLFLSWTLEDPVSISSTSFFIRDMKLQIYGPESLIPRCWCCRRLGTFGHGARLADGGLEAELEGDTLAPFLSSLLYPMICGEASKLLHTPVVTLGAALADLPSPGGRTGSLRSQVTLFFL